MTDAVMPPPRANPDLFGHEAAERTLADALGSGRMAHAWLICGPRGVGKATLAFRFARYVLAGGNGNAQTPGLFDALPKSAPPRGDLWLDPAHPVFRRVASGGHADLMTIERGVTDEGRRRSEIVVDDVRQVGAFLRLTAAEGGWRVVVIDAADDLNRNAANALLKVLEEPTPRALLLLVAHSVGGLLPTIRSRCRRLTLRPLADGLVAELVRRCRPEISPAAAAELARLAEGSLGRALTLADEDALDLHRVLMGLLDRLPAIDGMMLHAFGERLARPGAEDAYRTVIELLRAWLARLIVIAGGAGQRVPGASSDGETLERLAGRGLDRWLEVWENIGRILARADDANLDRKQVILNAFLALESAARR